MLNGDRERFWRAVREMDEKDAQAAQVRAVLERIQHARTPWEVYYKLTAQNPPYEWAIKPEWADEQERLRKAAYARSRELADYERALCRLVVGV